MDFARVTKLSDGNYESWAFFVKALLRRLKLWTYVDPGTRPAGVTVAEWMVGDEEALTTIQLLVEESQIGFIRDKQTAKATWEALKAHHSRLQRGSEERVLKVGSVRKVLMCHRCGEPVDSKDSGKANTKSLKLQSEKVREDGHDSSFPFVKREERSQSQSWVVDTGATSHLTSDRSGFVRFDKSVCPVISTAGGSALRTEGIGDYVLQCVDGNGQNVKITLTDVIYAPEVEGSLLSIGKLATKGVQAEFDEDKCLLLFGRRVIATADKSYDGLYRLKLASEKCVQVKDNEHKEDCLHTWHRRLGHQDPQTIFDLERQCLAAGIKVKNCGLLVKCECCVEGQISRPPVPGSNEKRSKAVLDVVHSDVCGPMTTSHGGCKYYMTMIDDHSRYTVVYFLKDLSEVEQKIQQYVCSVQKKFGQKPRIIRSAREGENMANGLRKICVEEGIKLEFTDASSATDEKRRSLNEMGLRMLLDAGLERSFWAEAVNTAAYIQNRLPSTAAETTPYEMWHCKQPDLSHMKVFGCSAFVRTSTQKEKLIFVGYSFDYKAYRLLEPKSGKVVTSRDVMFLELDNATQAVQAQAEEVLVRLPPVELNESDDEFFGFDDDTDDERLNDPDQERAEAVRGQEERNRVQLKKKLKDQQERNPAPAGYIGIAVEMAPERHNNERHKPSTADSAWIKVRRR